MNAKRDNELDKQAQEWIEAIVGEKFSAYGPTYEDALKNGIILCKLMNKLLPGSVPKINSKDGDFALVTRIHFNFKKFILVDLLF